MSDAWGNPENSTFRKMRVREAKQGEARAKLHVVIKPLAEELWAKWDEVGVDISRIGSWDADRLGKSFCLPEEVQLNDAALAAMDEAGFERSGAVCAFVASYDWAKAKGDELQLRDLGELADRFNPTPTTGTLPGSRELSKGDAGTDVSVVQLFLGVEDTGSFVEPTAAAMAQYRQLNRLAPGEDADAAFWAYVIPRVIRWKRMGEAGREVRLVQSALVTFGYQSAPVTGRYGMVMNRAVHRLREDRGIRGSTKVDNLVWQALFDLHYQAR